MPDVSRHSIRSTPEHKTTNLSRTCGHQSLRDAAQILRRTETSTASPRKPKISFLKSCNL